MSKILAIVCGKTNGQTERAARVALKAAKDKGCEVELINLMNLDIRACKGCNICTRQLMDPSFTTPCPLHDDDMTWLDERIYESDAVIFGAPMFEQSVPGPFKTMTDRFGPSHDVTFRKFAYDRRVAMGIDPVVDPRAFIKRPAAFFGLGGSEWAYLSFSTVGIPAIPLGLEIVDRAQFSWNTDINADPERVARLQKMGEHLADMINVPEGERTYIGEEGQCPCCHNDVFQLSPDIKKATCVLCGVIGDVVVDDDKNIRITFTEEMLKTSHVTDTGRTIHLEDLQGKGNQRKKLTEEQYAAGKQLAKELMLEIPDRRPEKK